MGDRGPDPEVSPADIVTLFEEREDPCEPLTAREVANELDCAKRTAHKWLQTAEDETALESKKVGAKARVWWLPC